MADQNPMGGLSRRATVLEEKKKSGLEFILVGLVGTFSSPSFESKRRKSTVSAEISADDGKLCQGECSGGGLGRKILFLEQSGYFKSCKRTSYHLLCLNLTCEGIDIQRYRKRQWMVLVHFYSFLTEKAKVEGCTVTPPLQAWQELRKEALGDINVMFSHLINGAER